MLPMCDSTDGCWTRPPICRCPARAILVEIARVHDGMNNGRLGVSVRNLARRCNVAPATVCRALNELQERGFIECVTKGAFSRKTPHASEWRLTWWPCDVTGALPAKTFMSWGREKQNTVLEYSPTVPIREHIQLRKSA
jgi:DNA-binding transcriptional MocR family regulator